MDTRDRIPGIEGMRAIAACAIALFHSTTLVKSGIPTGLSRPLVSGVTLFFVLSGFLLYRPLAARILDGRAPASIRSFYLRRARRIFPAYWAVLAAIVALGLAVQSRSLTGIPTIALDASLLHGFIPATIGTGLQPAWSLSAELGFYLVLPLLALFAATLARSGRISRDRAIWIAPAALFAVALATRALDQLVVPGPDRCFHQSMHCVLDRGTFANGDLFAFGMALAALDVVRGRGSLRAVEARLRPLAPLLVLATPAIVVLTYSRLDSALYDPLCALLFSGCLAITVWGWVPRLTGVLESGPLRGLGAISYSIFLWNLPVLLILLATGAITDHSTIRTIGALIAIGGPIACASYRYLERPWMAPRRSRPPAPAVLVEGA